MSSGDARFAQLPAVHRLIAQAEASLPGFPAQRLAAAARRVIDDERARLRVDVTAPPKSEGSLGIRLIDLAKAEAEPGYPRVINATGVVLHTNLGRAPLSAAAREAVAQAAGYCALELDLGTGKRSKRDHAVAQRLVALTGCEDALVVNNNAASMVLILGALGRGRSAVLSRGELVEIGGSFRMPDIMEASGVELIEIGTTNRTHLKDYASGLDRGASMVLRVHRSNFHVEGFTKQVALKELAELAAERGVPLVYDLGSGALDDDDPGEPGVRQALESGAGLVCFSGDKLLGGPQAGIIIGKAELVDRLRSDPLKRALRCDKLTLAALDACLRSHLGLVQESPPVSVALGAEPSHWRQRADSLRGRILAEVSGVAQHFDVEVIDVDGRVGGGSSPHRKLASSAIRLRPRAGGCEAAAARLRAARPAVMVRIHDDALEVHPLSLLPGDDDDLILALASLDPS